MLKINERNNERHVEVNLNRTSHIPLHTSQRGITLIALIITIIIMLILVGVTITVAVNGGLFNYAGRAGKETNEAIKKEQELASLEEGLTVDQLIEKYTTPNYADAKFENGVLTEKAKYTSGDYTAIIPKGFAISNVKEEQTIANGLVITDELDSQGNSIGNEFVWIPVEKAIVTESEIAKIIADSENPDMTPLDAVQSLANNGTYPMVVQVGTDYKGILYEFSGTDTLTATVYDWASTTSFREPEVLSGYDTQTNFTKYGLGTYSDNLYQNAYNQMVKSVANNGGFYVGRYELSLYTDSEDNTIKYAQTKKDQNALVSTTWYEIYKYERDYAKYNMNLGVTSEMIWGSQWDQMMIFVNGKNDGVGVKFYVTEAGSRKSGDSSTTTGNNQADQVANIFDLETSRFEWTQEAYSSNYRNLRGGNYGYSLSASSRACYYYGAPAENSLSSLSSRASLYIK